MKIRKSLATLIGVALVVAWLAPAASAVTLPLQGPDLRLWLDGSDIDGSNNSTLTDGDPVTTWTDKSTYGNNATAAAAIPAYSSAGLGGSPSVYFTSDYMTVADAPNLDGGEISIFMVYNLSSVPAGIMSKGRDNYGAWSIRRDGSNLFGYHFDSPATNYQATGSPWTLNQDQVTFNTFNGTALQAYQAGALRGSVATAGTPGSNAYAIKIGGFVEAAAGLITGDVAEVIVYDRALTPAEHASVGYYLTQKYALHSGYPCPGVVVTDDFTTGNQQAYAATVSASDLINQGQPSLASTSVSGYAAWPGFGPYTKMNDGILGGNTDGDNGNAVADSDSDFTITYFLDTSNVKGYAITEIRSYTAHQDNRVSQAFTVEYTTFDDPTWTLLDHFASDPHTGGAQQASRLTISGLSGIIVSGVTAIRFHVTSPPPNGNWSVWREFDVEGFAIPEPSTFILSALGLLGLGSVGWRRRKRAA